jgi:hypothetical protein
MKGHGLERRQSLIMVHGEHPIKMPKETDPKKPSAGYGPKARIPISFALAMAE